MSNLVLRLYATEEYSVICGCAGLASLYVQEDYDAGDVVYHTLLLSPPLKRRTHQILGRALRIFLQIKWVNYPRHVDVFEKLPNAITCNYHDFVIFGKAVFAHLGLGVAADGVCHRISK